MQPKDVELVKGTIYKVKRYDSEFLVDIYKDAITKAVPFKDDGTKLIIANDSMVSNCPNCGKPINRHVTSYSERIRKYHCTHCDKYFIKEVGYNPREISYRDWSCMMDSTLSYLNYLQHQSNYEAMVKAYSHKGDTNE